MEHIGKSITSAIERARAAMEPGAEQREAEFVRQTEAVQRAERARRLRDANVSLPEPIWEAIAGGREPRKTQSGQAVVTWWRDPHAPRVLVLGGRTGCGKTTAASWAIAQHDRGGRLRSASVIAQCWRSQSYTSERAREELAGCGVLVFDDVGAEHAFQREWTAVALRDLIELRQGEGLRTILTTNLARAELEKVYADQRLVSRLQRALWVADTGADLRSRKS